MDNIKIIDYALFVIGEVKTLIESWKAKPFIDADEQKKVTGMLVQILSNVWMVNSIAEERSAANTMPADKTDKLKKDLQEILAAVDKLHEKLTVRPLVPEPTALPDESQSQALETAPVRTVPDTAAPQDISSTPEEIPQEIPTEKQPVKQPVKPERAAHSKQTTPYPSLFNKFSTYDKDEPVLYTPINNLAEAIGLNDKFIFIRELFNNNEKEFSKTVVRLDNMSGLEEAQTYFSISVLNDANRNSHAAKQFGSLLIRRYMSR
ncbi:MAG: hypothetical protein LBF19_01980 [Prevotellaceae bacterium]|jgi:hypothetical protein|nr:hypothetical protein [Prevotellaceae bacterium]